MNKNKFKEWESFIINGFHLATDAGPLIGEPMKDVAFILEDLRCTRSILPRQMNHSDTEPLLDSVTNSTFNSTTIERGI